MTCSQPSWTSSSSRKRRLTRILHEIRAGVGVWASPEAEKGSPAASEIESGRGDAGGDSSASEEGSE